MWQGTPVRCAKLANERQGEVLIWLAPRFYPGKSGLHGLFISSPSRSEDGPTVYNDSSRYRVAKAGLRSRALLRVSTGTVPILERKLFIPIRHRRGYRSGSFWRWFDSATPRQIRIGDRVVLRFNPSNGEESVFLQFSR